MENRTGSEEAGISCGSWALPSQLGALTPPQRLGHTQHRLRLLRALVKSLFNLLHLEAGRSV